MIRVLLVDDQPLVRRNWSALLGRLRNVIIVGEARDGNEAVKLALDLQPDVILMDIAMPGLDGLEATRQIVERQGTPQVLMVTSSLDETLLGKAVQHGARGYVCKGDTFDELMPALLALQAKQHYYSKTVREQYPHILDTVRRTTANDD